MRKYSFLLIIFTSVILSLFFIKTADAAGVCDGDYKDSAGIKKSASDWCTRCGGETYHFCVGNIHYSFGCKSGPFGVCSCDESTAKQETCSAGCYSGWCSDYGCFDWHCDQARTCSVLSGGIGSCCPFGQVCTLDKILGASDCTECCKDTSKCSLPCTNPSKTDKICTPGCNVDQDPDCGCSKVGNGVCPPGCTSSDDFDCSTCVNPIKGDKKCTPGCSPEQDPECYCINGDYYCGVVNCDYTNDSDCAKTCSQFGHICCPSGQTCTAGKISGASDCAECCGDINNCSIPVKNCLQLKGKCCPLGETCTTGKISGASDCAECCGNLANCKTSASPGTPGTPGTPGVGTPGTPGGEIIQIQNPLTADSFGEIVDNIIDFIFKIAIVLAPLMVIVGGFLFLTAGGNLQQLTQAKNLLIWTAVGFLVVLLSKGILAIINQILGVKGG